MTAAAHQGGSGKRHRSFYMRAEDADKLTTLADDLHFETRRPRYEVFQALVDVARRHQAEIRDQLTGTRNRDDLSDDSPGKDGGPQ